MPQSLLCCNSRIYAFRKNDFKKWLLKSICLCNREEDSSLCLDNIFRDWVNIGEMCFIDWGDQSGVVGYNFHEWVESEWIFWIYVEKISPQGHIRSVSDQSSQTVANLCAVSSHCFHCSHCFGSTGFVLILLGVGENHSHVGGWSWWPCHPSQNISDRNFLTWC